MEAFVVVLFVLIFCIVLFGSHSDTTHGAPPPEVSAIRQIGEQARREIDAASQGCLDDVAQQLRRRS